MFIFAICLVDIFSVFDSVCGQTGILFIDLSIDLSICICIILGSFVFIIIQSLSARGPGPCRMFLWVVIVFSNWGIWPFQGGGLLSLYFRWVSFIALLWYPHMRRARVIRDPESVLLSVVWCNVAAVFGRVVLFAVSKGVLWIGGLWGKPWLVLLCGEYGYVHGD